MLSTAVRGDAITYDVELDLLLYATDRNGISCRYGNRLFLKSTSNERKIIISESTWCNHFVVLALLEVEDNHCMPIAHALRQRTGLPVSMH